VFKGILSNFKVQLVKMWEYLRELGWHFIFILLQVGAIIGVVGKPLVSQILKIYFTISELLCGDYWFEWILLIEIQRNCKDWVHTWANGIGHTLDPMENNRWSPISIQKWILIKGLVSGFREPLWLICLP
jgi:hypothetical protein